MSVLLSSLEGIIIIVQNFIAAIGYPGIFALMLLEGLLIPVPSEVVLAFGGYLALTGALPPSDRGNNRPRFRGKHYLPPRNP